MNKKINNNEYKKDLRARKNTSVRCQDKSRTEKTDRLFLIFDQNLEIANTRKHKRKLCISYSWALFLKLSRELPGVFLRENAKGGCELPGVPGSSRE